MQVIGLPSHSTRNGWTASRLVAAKTPNGEAARRRDAVVRREAPWPTGSPPGRPQEPSAFRARYRWEGRSEPLSRRPHRPRGRQWTHELVRAVEDLRQDNPMWGKRKIAIVAVPVLRRRPQARRIRFRAKKRDARRLAKGRKAKSPGELGQIDTLVVNIVNIGPDKPVKHFTAYDPVAKWTIGRVSTEASAKSAKPLLDKLLIEAPFPIRGIRLDGGAEFKSVFEAECQAADLGVVHQTEILFL